MINGSYVIIRDQIFYIEKHHNSGYEEKTMSNQNIAIKNKRLYCGYCEANPLIEIPIGLDLTSSSGTEFVRNVRCTICKNIGKVRLRQ